MATASRVQTLHSKTIYATDLTPPRPIAPENLGRVAKNDRTIRVGHVEQTPFGTLRCLRVRDAIVITLEKGKRRVGRKLILPRARAEADCVRESDFSVQVGEFIGTPWHELDYISFWTVHGLRTNGTMEASRDR